MHDWFLTACLLGFFWQDKNVWKIWEVCFNLGVWPLALLWHCRFAGNRREENLGIFMSFHCLLPLHTIGESPEYLTQAVLLLSSLWSVRSHNIPYTAVCSFPSPHNKCLCYCCPSLQKDWGTIMWSPEYPYRKQTPVCYKRTIFV